LTLTSENYVLLATRLFEQLDPPNGDLLFNIFGPGNTVNGPNRPFERFEQYEALLRLLRRHDQARYEKFHKGTAFWFLSWLAFDLRNYPKALFYMDAAISEDVRRAPDIWLKEPAGAFLTLAIEGEGPGQHVSRLRQVINEHLARFNNLSGELPLTIDDVLSGFVTGLLENPRHRTIVSAWYIHLLEFEERVLDLELRSIGGGSIAPFLDHLFRGGLLFESVLKTLYTGENLRTLGDIFYNSPEFREEFGTGFKTSAAGIGGILASIGAGNLIDAFSVSAKLRNTTGHSLVWDDAFTDPDSFRKLYEHEVNAMLYVVSRRFRVKPTAVVGAGGRSR
jgi:hypothetical protein